ncbi:MAG: GNAT family N-acetyltransferase [Candidatus Kapabacteria bacterium]|nr:GNAT family N-acetyltransferase [Candidatus Kapabacteria bacterium]
MNPDTITLRPLCEDDSITHITQLLHRAYANLAAMGLRYHATWQDDDVTRSRLEGVASIIAETDGVIVGTVTLYSCDDAESPCDWYRKSGVYTFGQFGVEPQLQRSGIGRRMMERIEHMATAMGAEELACDTAMPAEHLIRWYTAMGYRPVDEVQWDITNYRSIVLSKRLRME